MPKGAPPPDPFGPPPPPKATYADLVEAVRLAYPGQFDDEDPGALAESVLEVYPQFGDQVDHTTKGMEILPAHAGGPRTSRDFEKTPKGEWVPKKAGPGHMEMTPALEKELGNNRKAGWGDMAVTTAARVGGSVAGGAVGTLAAAATANPLAVPAGLFVGGSAGEAAAQLYERAAGISEEISPGNIVAQGALNMVPVARLGKAGVTGAARLIGANAVKGGATRKAAAGVIGAMRSTGLPARMAAGAVEGAVTSAGGAGLEIGFEQRRPPTLEEVAGAAVMGAGFGGALPAGGELWRAGKRARAKPALRAANAAIDSMDPQVGGAVLPVEMRTAATQQVVEALEKAARLDPVGGKAAYSRLMSVLDGQHQADLQVKAAGFLQKFADVSSSMSDTERFNVAKDFLARVKQDGLAAEHLDGVITTLAGIDTDARMAQSTGGMKMLPPGPPEAVLGAGGRDILPVEPRLAEGPGGPPIVVDPEGAALLRGREDLDAPPALVTDQPARPRPVIAGRLREAAPPPPPPGPPAVDWSRAKGPEELGFDRTAESAQRTAAASGVEGIKAGLLPYASQERLPGLPEVPAGPPPPPKTLEGLPKMGAVAEGPGNQNRVPEGVDTLYHVRAGTIDRDTAVMLQVLRQELREFRYQPAEAKGRGIEKDRARERYDGSTAFQQNQATPRVASTKAARTIAKILGKEPKDLNRRELQQQIENFLSGRQAQPSPTVRAVLKYVGLMRKAWDGQGFSVKKLTPHDIREAGLPGKLNDIHLPVLGPGQVLGLDEADDLLEKFAPQVLGEKRGLQADVLLEEGLPTGAEPRAGAPPPQMAELLASMSDRELKLLHGELLQQGPDGMQYRGWVADALEQRGLARPEQATLVEEGPSAPPPPPSERLLALENAASAPVPRGTPDVVGKVEDVPGDVPAAPVYASQRVADAEARVLGDDTTPFDADLETLAAAEAQGGALDLREEGGAVGTPAQRAAARQRILKNLADSSGAPRHFRMNEDTLGQVRKVVEQAGESEEAGLLVGTPDGQIRKVIRSRNIAADTATTFEIDPRTIAATQKRAADEGLVLLGSWHSQPTGSAQPSRADLKGGVADLPMLIIGAKGGEVRDVRVWQPKGKSAWAEGGLDIGELSRRPGDVPTTAKSVQATIRKIPRFTGAMGDDAALGKYLEQHADELDTEPFFHKAQEALAAGNARKAWLELQIAQVAYGNLTKTAAKNLPYMEGVDVAKRVAALEGGSAQSPAGQLWALYDGRTVWAPGVGRIVVTPDLPPSLKGQGITAGPGGILRPGAAVEGALPDQAMREAITLNVVNDVLKDVDAVRVLDDPTKTAGTRLFRQVAEQMLLSPSNFKAVRALGGDEAQVAAHFTETVTEAARVLASLSAWKREHGAAIRRIEGIKGASGEADLVIHGKGRTVGRLSDLYKGQTFDALTGTGSAWDRVILLQALTPGQIGKFDQFGRASRGFMLSQWSTALRNVHSATGRWGSDISDTVHKGLAYTTSGEFNKAKASFARAGDLLRYAPILRPDGWVMPWRARASEWETIFDTSGQILSMGKDREAVLAALRAVPDKAAAFMGGTGFGETVSRGQSSSTILNALASEKVQQTLTMFNRAQEYTIRSAMLHVSLNEQLRLRGLDPHTALSLPPERLRALLGEDGYTQVFDKAVGEALNFTFAGDLIRKGYGTDHLNRPKGGANTGIIDILNKLPIVREGYPFAKFNLSAAPRYLWDHSGLGLLVEPLYAKVAGRGRYHLGTTGKRFRDVLIPEIDQKVGAAQVEMGTALNTWQGVKDEITARRRLDARYQKMSVGDASLPGIADKIQANRTALNALEATSMEAGERYTAADKNLKDLLSQKATLAEVVAQAAAADAPEDFQTLFARNMTGAAVMLPLAMMIRASQKDEGTPWYKVKVSENHTVDLRPFAPFVQYLFVADVLQDFYDNTDWGMVSEDLDLGKYSWDNIGEAFFKGGRYDGAYAADDIAKGLLSMVSAGLWDLVEMPGSAYQFYEGKYTSQSLGKEIMNVAASTSQLAGTTLSLVEALADIGTEGLPGTERGINLAANTVGQMLARFTMPFAQFKGLSALYDDEERYARIADQGEEMSLAPLGQFMANIPFVGAAAIPETYNQLTGQPLASQYPLLRSLGGVTVGSWDKVTGEIARIGMPGASVYIRKTGDVYVDKLIGYHYAKLVQEYLPQVLEDPEYQKLDTPALRRDALGKILPKLKKAAIGYTTMDVGVERIKSAQAGSETRRRQARVARLQELLTEEGLRDLAPEEPEEPEEPETPEIPEEPEVESTPDALLPQ